MIVLYYALGVQLAAWTIIALTCCRDYTCRFLINVLARAQGFLYWSIRVPVWRTADGRVLRADQFDDQHLLNTLRLLGPRSHPIRSHLEAEVVRRKLRLKPCRWH